MATPRSEKDSKELAAPFSEEVIFLAAVILEHFDGQFPQYRLVSEAELAASGASSAAEPKQSDVQGLFPKLHASISLSNYVKYLELAQGSPPQGSMTGSMPHALEGYPSPYTKVANVPSFQLPGVISLLKCPRIMLAEDKAKSMDAKTSPYAGRLVFIPHPATFVKAEAQQDAQPKPQLGLESIMKLTS